MRWLLLFLALPLAAQNALWLDLTGPWRMIAGDDPGYAQRDINESAWQTINAPLPSEITGSFWLRRRVELPTGTDRTRLALTLGTIPDVYELYVNGQRLGATGNFHSFEDAPIPQPHTFEIPVSAVAGEESLQIALRVRSGLMVRPVWKLVDRGPYLLTYREQAPLDAARAQFDRMFVQNSPRVAFGTMIFGIALLSLLAWWSDRARWEMLWFTIYLFARGYLDFISITQMNAAARPFNAGGSPTIDIVGISLVPALLGEFAMAALGTRRRQWWRLGLWIGFLLGASGPFFASGARGRFFLGNVACASVTIVIALLDWWRVRGKGLRWDEHLMRLTLVMLASSVGGDFLMRLFGVPSIVPVTLEFSGYLVPRTYLLVTVQVALILVTLLRRLLSDRRERERLAGELEAARTVQQLLLPQSQVASTQFAVEAVYEPAHEVGGDFHWNRAGSDGSLVAVVGDVSGKGLKPAMLVSVAVGILRNEKSVSPAAILGALNDGLAGHTGGGFVTCCCARFDPGGTVTIANAGHPRPYCDGREVTLEAGLPLGIAHGSTYVETVERGTQFTLLSDGVVEAANTTGELFGFDRTRQISGKSAAEIAEAAKAWGQNDDITVVTVRRLA